MLYMYIYITQNCKPTHTTPVDLNYLLLAREYVFCFFPSFFHFWRIFYNISSICTYRLYMYFLHMLNNGRAYMNASENPTRSMVAGMDRVQIHVCKCIYKVLYIYRVLEEVHEDMYTNYIYKTLNQIYTYL